MVDVFTDISLLCFNVKPGSNNPRSFSHIEGNNNFPDYREFTDCEDIKGEKKKLKELLIDNYFLLTNILKCSISEFLCVFQ